MDTRREFPDPRLPGLSEVLLSGEALLSAIRGHHVGNSPLAILAYELGTMHHRHLIELESQCRCRPEELVLAVDVWMGNHLPIPHPAATLHTETLGTVIDRLAYTQVRAYHLLMTVDVSDPQVHAAWYQLAELVDGYTDLVTAITQRSRRLPVLGDGR